MWFLGLHLNNKTQTKYHKGQVESNRNDLPTAQFEEYLPPTSIATISSFQSLI